MNMSSASSIVMPVDGSFDGKYGHTGEWSCVSLLAASFFVCVRPKRMESDSDDNAIDTGRLADA